MSFIRQASSLLDGKKTWLAALAFFAIAGTQAYFLNDYEGAVENAAYGLTAIGLGHKGEKILRVLASILASEGKEALTQRLRKQTVGG